MKRIVNISLSICKNKWYLLILSLILAWLPFLGIEKMFSKQLWFTMKGRDISLDRIVTCYHPPTGHPQSLKWKGQQSTETFSIMIPENRKNFFYKRKIGILIDFGDKVLGNLHWLQTSYIVAITLNFLSSGLCFPVAKITGMSYNTYLYTVLLIEPRVCVC